MKKINAAGICFKELNQKIAQSTDKNIEIENCLGHRYIGAGLSGKNIKINGVPGNALGAYLVNGRIVVNGNAQDATGDTMDNGEIVIHGSCGDGVGYSMRGGKILIKGDVGYRAGIHMKAYKTKMPVLVIGGRAGSFLGEYQAGGLIIVLGLGTAAGMPIVHNFCGTGMHGGQMFLRTSKPPYAVPGQVLVKEASEDDMSVVEPHVRSFCKEFGGEAEKILQDKFLVLTPNKKNPYREFYVYN